MWIAKYKDGTSLSQFLDNDETKEERLFDDIDQSKLESFEVLWKGKVFGVNLPTGRFSINGNIVEFVQNPGDIKLIYYRRVEKDLSTHPTQVLSTRIDQNIGWQSTYINAETGKTDKIIMTIFESGLISYEINL